MRLMELLKFKRLKRKDNFLGPSESLLDLILSICHHAFQEPAISFTQCFILSRLLNWSSTSTILELKVIAEECRK